MSNFNNKTITAKGLELLSGALVGDEIQFTRIVMGDGECTEDIGLTERLIGQKQSLEIKSMSRNGSKVVLSGVLAQTQIKEDFYWKEIGVYAKGSDGIEILYLYGTAKPNEYSYISKDMLNEKLINIGVLVGSAQNISATISESLLYLSKEDLDNHNNDLNAHVDIRKAIENQKSTIDGNENEIVTISKDNKAKTSGIGINTVALIDKKSPLSTKMLEDADTLNGHNSEYFLNKIADNTKQINNLNDNVNLLGNEINNLNDNVNLLGNEINNLNDNVNLLGNEINNLNDNVNLLGNEINNLNDNVNLLGNEINNLNDDVSNLGNKIRKTVLDLSTITDELMLKSVVTVTSGSSAFPKLPKNYTGIVSIYSKIKGEYYESYFVQITNKYAYKKAKLLENRFNNTSDELSVDFTYVDSTDFVLLSLHNNTAIDGNFYITLTQNQKGDV